MISQTEDRFVILLDGPVTPTARLRQQLAGRRVIAADGGIRHAEPLDLAPELWVGDFDSSDGLEAQAHPKTVREAYPSEKAISDGNIALERALKLGARDILVCGATGGPRTDHVLFNLSALVTLAARHDLTVFASDGLQECYPIIAGNQLKPDVKAGSTFSIFGFSDIMDLSVTGAKWPLIAESVDFGNSLTLSNVVHHGFSVEMQSGHALLIVQLGDGPQALDN